MCRVPILDQSIALAKGAQVKIPKEPKTPEPKFVVSESEEKEADENDKGEEEEKNQKAEEEEKNQKAEEEENQKAEETPDYDSLDEEEEDVPEISCYFHVTACANGGIAALDANFAREIYLTAKKMASKKPNQGFISFYQDFGKQKLSQHGGMYHIPGQSYLVPADGYIKPMKKSVSDANIARKEIQEATEEEKERLRLKNEAEAERQQLAEEAERERLRLEAEA